MPDYESPEGIRPGKPSIQAVQGPSPVYLTGEEWVRVRSAGLPGSPGLALSITGRLLRPDSTPVPLQERHVPNANRTIATSVFPLSEGWLLDLAVSMPGFTAPMGNIWVALDLVRGGGSSPQFVQSLVFGYVTTNMPLTFPSGQNMSPTDGPGNVRSIQVTSPAAGAEWSQTVPTNARWEVVSVFAQLTTSAAVANRLARLVMDDGANFLNQVPGLSAQTAGTVIGYCWGDGQGGPIIANDTVAFSGPFANDCYLSSGFRIRSLTGGLQAADQWGSINFLVREWLDV